MRNTDYDDRSYKRCKLCGMPVKIDREHFTGIMNTSARESIVENSPYDTHNSYMDISDDLVLPKLDLSGEPNNFVRVTYYSKVNNGCWFCGNSRKDKLSK